VIIRAPWYLRAYRVVRKSLRLWFLPQPNIWYETDRRRWMTTAGYYINRERGA
jgi:hypothetical protein